MSNELAIFKYGREQVRIVKDEQGEPWWVAKDVCEILGINSEQVRRLDDDEKGLRSIQTLGGMQEMITINESGLYALILGSRKKEAKHFKRWISHDVVPSIRKHGAYMTPEIIEKALADPDTIIKLATSLKEERTRRKALEAEKAMLSPKAEQFDLFMDGTNNKTMEAVAKSFGTGRQRLFKFLKEQKILMTSNRPYQKYLDMGYFVVKEKPIKMGDSSWNYSQTYVTPRGQTFIGRLLQQKAA